MKKHYTVLMLQCGEPVALQDYEPVLLGGATKVESSWNLMAQGDAQEGKWRRNWRMECVASTLHTTAEHGVSSITTADAHTSAASRRLKWRPRRIKWTRPFRRKTKSGFCARAITFQTQYNIVTVTAGRYAHTIMNFSFHTWQLVVRLFKEHGFNRLSMPHEHP